MNNVAVLVDLCNRQYMSVATQRHAGESFLVDLHGVAAGGGSRLEFDAFDGGVSFHGYEAHVGIRRSRHVVSTAFDRSSTLVPNDHKAVVHGKRFHRNDFSFLANERVENRGVVTFHGLAVQSSYDKAVAVAEIITGPELVNSATSAKESEATPSPQKVGFGADKRVQSVAAGVHVVEGVVLEQNFTLLWVRQTEESQIATSTLESNDRRPEHVVRVLGDQHVADLDASSGGDYLVRLDPSDIAVPFDGAQERERFKTAINVTVQNIRAQRFNNRPIGEAKGHVVARRCCDHIDRHVELEVESLQLTVSPFDHINMIDAILIKRTQVDQVPARLATDCHAEGSSRIIEVENAHVAIGPRVPWWGRISASNIGRRQFGIVGVTDIRAVLRGRARRYDQQAENGRQKNKRHQKLFHGFLSLG